MPAGLSCPRCAYDLSGVIATWDAACPLTGTCSECGLEFAWVDVFRPDRERLKGFFEHANTRGREIRWCFTTLGWTVLPWRFWSRVTLFVSPRPRRAVIWLIFISFLLHAAGSSARTAALSPHLYTVAQSGTLNTWGYLFPSLLNAWIAPLARVMSWTTGAAATTYLWEWNLAPWSAPVVLLIAEGAAWPLMFLVLGETLRVCRVRRAHLVRAYVYSLAWIPLSLTVLMSTALLGAVVSFIEFAAQAPAGSVFTSPGLRASLPRVTHAAAVLWIPVWWWFAIRRGLQLRHAGWVWLLFLVASVLFAANAVLLVGALHASILAG